MNAADKEEIIKELKDFLDEKLDDMEDRWLARVGLFQEILEKINPEQMEKPLKPIMSALGKYEKNSTKFETMVKELNGCVVRCRALFDRQRNTTPVWYEIRKCSPPEHGEIWIKDINGSETLAKCEGRAIIYPASSSLKSPEFWKPV